MAQRAKAAEHEGEAVQAPLPIFKLNLAKDLATTIPIAHILAACAFLFGYCGGFGNHIIAFVTVSDVFAVSLRALGHVYLFVLLPIVILFVLRLIRSIKSIRSVEKGSRDTLALYGFPLLIVILLLALALAPQLFTERATSAAERRNIAAMVAILAGFQFWLIAADLKGRLWGKYASQSVVIVLAIILTLSAVLGANKGLIDSARRYESTAASYSRCGATDKVIVRPIGSYFLALDSTNAWSLVDDECEPRFTLRPGTPNRAAANRATANRVTRP